MKTHTLPDYKSVTKVQERNHGNNKEQKIKRKYKKPVMGRYMYITKAGKSYDFPAFVVCRLLVKYKS